MSSSAVCPFMRSEMLLAVVSVVAPVPFLGSQQMACLDFRVTKFLLLLLLLLTVMGSAFSAVQCPPAKEGCRHFVTVSPHPWGITSRAMKRFEGRSRSVKIREFAPTL